MAEEARLESVCTPKAYRGFESRSLRNILPKTVKAYFTVFFLQNNSDKTKEGHTDFYFSFHSSKKREALENQFIYKDLFFMQSIKE